MSNVKFPIFWKSLVLSPYQVILKLFHLKKNLVKMKKPSDYQTKIMSLQPLLVNKNWSKSCKISQIFQKNDLESILSDFSAV